MCCSRRGPGFSSHALTWDLATAHGIWCSLPDTRHACSEHAYMQTNTQTYKIKMTKSQKWLSNRISLRKISRDFRLYKKMWYHRFILSCRQKELKIRLMRKQCQTRRFVVWWEMYHCVKGFPWEGVHQVLNGINSLYDASKVFLNRYHRKDWASLVKGSWLLVWVPAHIHTCKHVPESNQQHRKCS